MRIAFAVPGDIQLATGGYAYARKILALLPSYGVDVDHISLPGTYPFPSIEDQATSLASLLAVVPDQPLLIDGLAYGAFSPEMMKQLERRSIVALVHHPLCLETGLTTDQMKHLRHSETQALSYADHIIVTSRATADGLIEDFRVPAARITVAEPGTEPAQRASGSKHAAMVNLLAVGSIISRKGYSDLIEALAPLVHLSWHLSIAGALDRSPQALSALQELIERYEMGAKITLCGSVDEQHMTNLYDSADIFVHAALYEGFGMVLTEALAHGLAIVATRSGPALDLIPPDACMTVGVGDKTAMSDALRALILDGERRTRLSKKAWEAARYLPRWRDTMRQIASVITKSVSSVSFEGASHG